MIKLTYILQYNMYILKFILNIYYSHSFHLHLAKKKFIYIKKFY